VNRLILALSVLLGLLVADGLVRAHTDARMAVLAAGTPPGAADRPRGVWAPAAGRFRYRTPHGWKLDEQTAEGRRWRLIVEGPEAGWYSTLCLDPTRPGRIR
jgi:hypothetical protein